MIRRGTTLNIYEILGEMGPEIPSPPSSCIGVWNEEELSYIFFSQPEDEYIRALTSSMRVSLRSHNQILYEDWQTLIPPEGLSIGPIRLVAEDDPCPAQGALRLDPSVVFGDGSHPTTARCAGFLSALMESRPIGSVLDLGTGTGILALAAATMGARRVLAVDRNYLAVATTRKNVELNGLGSIIEVGQGEARLFMHHPFDLVMANLPFQVLRDILVMQEARLHKAWVVSGINRDQAEVLKGLLCDQGFVTETEQADHPWLTFVSVRPG